jgi:acyl CoA:acetate/3-ketoacid CoA transferase alpha subunit
VIDKRVSSFKDAAKDILGGAVVMIGGFGSSGISLKLFMLIRHTTRGGEPEILEECSYPLTGARLLPPA